MQSDNPMNSDERHHTQRLLETHRARMRELELKAAKYGELEVPAHLSLELRDLRATVGEIETQLRAALPQHNLPPRDYERFVGRTQELAELRRLLGPRSRAFVVTVDGIGGIGKSALALETAYAFVDQYAALPERERFKAIVWVSAKRSYLTATGILERRQAFRTLDDLYTAIAQVLDYPAITRARADERRAIVEQALGEQRTLLIIDNLETVDDEDLMVLLRELPDPTKALVTTRHRIDVAYPIRLAGMPHEDALALIAQEAERKDVTLSSDDQEALWQRTGGMPLALVWSIGLMGLGGSVGSVLRRLGSGQSDIAQFCFAESMTYIEGRDAYWLLLALVLFAVDASREALGVVAGLDNDEFGRDMGLEELLRLSLVNKEGERFSLLPLTRSFVESLTQNDDGWRQSATERFHRYFLDLCAKYGGWSRDYRGHDRVEREWQNVVTAIDALAAAITYTRNEDGDLLVSPESYYSARLLLTFILDATQTLRLRGYLDEVARLCQQSINVSQALANASGEQADLEQYGWSVYQLSKHSYIVGDAATLEQLGRRVLSWGEQIGEVRMQVMGLRQLADALLQNQQIDTAEVYLQQAFSLTEQEWTLLRRHLYGISGRIPEYRGDFEKALEHYQLAADTYRERADLPALSQQLLNAGRVRFALGDITGAEASYRESLALARESGRIDIIARVLLVLAKTGLSRNEKGQMIDDARQALDLFRRLGMKREQAEAEALLATIAATGEASA